MDDQIKTKNIPTVFIIFGATGDLMGKKIVPALFLLYKKGKFPKLFKIIGFSRRNLSEKEFINFVREILIKHIKDVSNEDLEKFLSYFLYQQGDFEAMSYYKILAGRLGIIDGQWSVCSNKLFYLAVPPKYYQKIFERLAGSGLTIPCGPDEGWTRVIVEKPFGHDLKTAEELDTLLAQLFKEEQIYRIDHYLAKEMLQNILVFRFSNNLFEEEWGNKLIDKIKIRTWELNGVENRGHFYDGIGALRDVGQNHLLQMLALVTMDRPSSYDSDEVRKKRAELLSTLVPLSEEDIKQKTFRGQYKGYEGIAGVKKNSKTETYFRAYAALSHPKWVGVEIMLEAGKRLALRKEIEIVLKHPIPCLCPPGKHFRNRIIIGIEPREGISIEFWSKKSGLDYKIHKRKFNFIFRRVNERVQYVEEYEKLLLDCISGNQVLFLSTPEITTSWKYIDPIISSWKKNEVPLTEYIPDTKDVISEADKYFISQKKELLKEVGIVGLGKMGENVARRLAGSGWRVVGYNRTPDVVRIIEKEGVDGANSLAELVRKLSKPRTIILILTAGQPTDEVLNKLIPLLDPGDIIVEGANSFYKDTIRRFKLVKKKGLMFVDVGISGGPGGALTGACLMVGGDNKLFKYLEPLFVAMAAPGAVMHFEGVGAGHFVKMVHNGIEYGMMQSIAEGFNILKNGPYKNLNMRDITTIYQNGSVVESRLVGWLQGAFMKFGNNLEQLSGAVGFTGEGEWTAKVAKQLKFPIKIIEGAVEFRKQSQKKPSYAGKVLTGMRNQFGGHSIEKGKMT